MKGVVLLCVSRILFSIRDIKLRVFAPGSPGTRLAPGVRHYRSKVKIIRVISLNLNSFETAEDGERGEEEGIKIEKRHLRSFLLFFGTSHFGRPLLAVVKCNPAARSTFAERQQQGATAAAA